MSLTIGYDLVYNSVRMKELTEKQVLEQVIGKAIENGYTAFSRNLRMDPITNKKAFLDGVIDHVIKTKATYEIIFDHDFAEAFAKYLIDEKPVELSYWVEVGQTFKIRPKSELVEFVKTVFLLEVVLKKNPIDYLRRFLEGVR